MTAGGILLAPAALLAEPALPAFSLLNVAGIAYLGLIGAALTYVLGFAAWRGWNRPWCPRWAFSPVTAVLLGWGVLGQSLSAARWSAWRWWWPASG